MSSTAILISACVFLVLFLSISLYFNFKFGRIILKIQDAIEESLDVLDERYASMSKILEIPIFFDSLEVRQVISDIEKSRDSILYVANQFAVIDETEVTEEVMD